MPTHLFKIALPSSSLFIHSIDLTKLEIVYEVRDDEGKKIEPVHISKLVQDPGGNMNFDSRFIDLRLAKYIQETLT